MRGFGKAGQGRVEGCQVVPYNDHKSRRGTANPCLGEILYSSFQSYLLGEIRVGRQEAPEVCYAGHECRNREAGTLKFTASGLTLRCIRLLWNICNDRSSLFRSVAEGLQAKTGYYRPSSNSVMFLHNLTQSSIGSTKPRIYEYFKHLFNLEP